MSGDNGTRQEGTTPMTAAGEQPDADPLRALAAQALDEIPGMSDAATYLEYLRAKRKRLEEAIHDKGRVPMKAGTYREAWREETGAESVMACLIAAWLRGTGREEMVYWRNVLATRMAQIIVERDMEAGLR